LLPITAPVLASITLLLRSDIVNLRKSVGNIVVDNDSIAVVI
jgi:hypothetical protein